MNTPTDFKPLIQAWVGNFAAKKLSAMNIDDETEAAILEIEADQIYECTEQLKKFLKSGEVPK